MLLTTLISFLVVLGILVFVHELGHFLAAKKAGVHVETFSLGMGPKFFRKQVGGTEYCLSAIPLGGYVKLKGENPDEGPTGAPDELMAKSIPQRLSIFLAGPVMNVLLAILLVSLVYFIGIQMPKYLEEPPVIGWVNEESPAEQMGLQPGDVILSVSSTPVDTWEQAMLYIASNGGNPLDLTIKRGESTQTVTGTPEVVKELGAGYIGIQPVMEPVVGGIQSGFPAEEAGIQPGDEIVNINGTPIHHWIQMANIIHAHPEEALQITIQRDGERIDKTISPKLYGEYGYLGITSQQQTVLKKYGVIESISRGISRCWELTKMTFDLLRRLVTRQASTRTIGGPIMIAQMSGEVAKQGLSEILNFMGLISLSLGIFNLLPIPILDGGHIFLLFVEFLNRKPLSIKKRELAQKIGLLILIPLFLMVFYNDIARLLGW
ncbi:RIP metalloprotease RseP [candidate division KSB3 bacterium]|uniref:Zinc metalloprotease n=1 Tax=candidate division KSB3 bacterium TaxID=2044937 RepID=A0A9D5JXJ4_9BACT|nr:RIP metalloprotease RseP [candidate division KSB3 bacterium]MBD3325960.1 RIP metalloprotease RseP [candidate division KSB3 bacterium]